MQRIVSDYDTQGGGLGNLDTDVPLRIVLQSEKKVVRRTGPGEAAEIRPIEDFDGDELVKLTRAIFNEIRKTTAEQRTADEVLSLKQGTIRQLDEVMAKMGGLLQEKYKILGGKKKGDSVAIELELKKLAKERKRLEKLLTPAQQKRLKEESTKTVTKELANARHQPVSYTHLTLPTKA